MQRKHLLRQQQHCSQVVQRCEGLAGAWNGVGGGGVLLVAAAVVAAAMVAGRGGGVEKGNYPLVLEAFQAAATLEPPYGASRHLLHHVPATFTKGNWLGVRAWGGHNREGGGGGGAGGLWQRPRRHSRQQRHSIQALQR